MKTIFETIHELEELKKNQKHLQSMERDVARPLCSDLGKMQQLYDRFCEVRGVDGDGRSVFILIASRVYSPKALIGHKLGAGVRAKMADILGIEPTIVSHALDNLMFRYKRYRDFREDVDATFAMIYPEKE